MTSTYRPEYVPSTQQISAIFADEISSLGGSVADVYDDGQRLFMRAVLASTSEVRPGDAVNAGIAVRAIGPEIVVHPYTFRQVCSNGAIAAHALQSRRLERLQFTEVFLPVYEIAVIKADLVDAVRASATADAFATSAATARV
ncbi:MAG TPA: hypothetical protein VFT29_11150 [Gemmatimonadaceae bacterium]|nr:hypothetical protein [Gemmatimonadaceae bacterium]